MKKKPVNFLLSIIACIMLIAGVSYAFFEYYNEDNDAHELIAGDIYVNFNDDVSTFKVNGIYPMTDEDAANLNNNYMTFNVNGRNTTSDNDIYYAITLNYGDPATDVNKVRFNDKDLRFELVKIVGNEETVLVDGLSYESIEEQIIWVDTIPRNTDSELDIEYRLRVWVSEDVIISDSLSYADYTTEDYRNRYASIKVGVVGDFAYKEIVGDIRATGRLKTSGTVYDLKSNFFDVNYVDEDVRVKLSCNKQVSSIVVINTTTSQTNEYNPTYTNNKYEVEIDHNVTGRYIYYGILENGSYTNIGTYNIKIDKTAPIFLMENGGTVIVDTYNSYYNIENHLTNLSDENDYYIEYAIVEKDDIPTTYNKITFNQNYTINASVPSGVWDLVVRVVDDSGRESIDRTTYTVSYYAPINANNSSNYTIPKNRIQLVKGQTYEYIESLTPATHASFLGYSTDMFGGSMINDEIVVEDGVDALYAIWLTAQNSKVTIPMSSEYCSNPVYNGHNQTIVRKYGLGMTFSNEVQKNAGSYIVTAVLNSGFTWKDGTSSPVTFECNIAKKNISYRADSATKEYDGTPLTKNTATLTSGSLVSGHTASFTITGSQTNGGTSENVLSSVTINDASNNNVTSNYNIARTNGTLRVTTSSVVSCSFSPPQRSIIGVGGTTTIALTCTSDGQIADSVINASDITLSNSGVVSVGTPVKSNVTGGYRYVVTLTGVNAGSTTLTLNAGSVSVMSGNVNSSTVSNAINVDSVKPSCSFSLGSSTIGVNGTTTVTMSCTDANSIKSPPALTISDFSSWSMLQITGVSAPASITNGVKYTLTVKGLTAGVGKVTIKANRLRDNADNYNEQTSSAYITVDGEAGSGGTGCKYRYNQTRRCTIYSNGQTYTNTTTSGYIYNSSNEAVNACNNVSPSGVVPIPGGSCYVATCGWAANC